MNVSHVGCTLGFEVTEPAEIVLLIAVADPATATELLSVSSGGLAVDAVELPGRQHLVRAPVGTLTVTYSAEVAARPATGTASREPARGTPGDPAGPATGQGSGRPAEEATGETTGQGDGLDVSEYDRIVALRPSRYCPSDKIGGLAARLFLSSGPAEPVDIVRTVADWVFENLAYTGGSSGPTTDAVDTLLGGAGVCRDYAHLVATFCRALNIPARVAAVYAPGLSPMDFHLVVETALDGRWWVWDATRLAPRQSLIRIATGRDAADTALATTLSGMLTMPETFITAVAPGDLPVDDHTGLVALA